MYVCIHTYGYIYMDRCKHLSYESGINTVIQNLLVYIKRIGSNLCPTFYFYLNCISGRLDMLRLPTQYES